MRAREVYLDYNASAPPRACVLEALRNWPAQAANPSSTHAAGRTARERMDTARGQVAALVGATPEQVIFNSGATEGNNTVLSAFAGQRIWVSAIEHPSILEAAPDAVRLPVTPGGTLDLEALDRLMETVPPPALISVMAVNNETGVIQPLEEVVRRARRCNAAVHVDAVQAAGRIPLDIGALGADILTLSSHKIGGLPGTGALVLGACAPPPVLLRGGGQERRARAGTENIPGIVAFGLVAREAREDMDRVRTIATLRDDLESRIKTLASQALFFGQDAPRVGNTSLFALPGLSSRTAVMHMDLCGVAVSAGAACSSGVVKSGAVLRAMGVPEDVASNALRVSMGWGTTGEEVDRFLTAFEVLVDRIEGRKRAGP
jgi:cysteine desulfurase